MLPIVWTVKGKKLREGLVCLKLSNTLYNLLRGLLGSWVLRITKKYCLRKCLLGWNETWLRCSSIWGSGLWMGHARLFLVATPLTKRKWNKYGIWNCDFSHEPWKVPWLFGVFIFDYIGDSKRPFKDSQLNNQYNGTSRSFFHGSHVSPQM